MKEKKGFTYNEPKIQVYKKDEEKIKKDCKIGGRDNYPYLKQVNNNDKNNNNKTKMAINNKLNMTNNSFMKKTNNESYFKDLFDDNYLKENDLEINEKLKSLIPGVKKMRSDM